MSYIVIGDIHGCARKLNRLLDRIESIPNRIAVFVGDYVDIGPDSKQVITRLIEFSRIHPNTIFLGGNHDFGMLEYLQYGNFVKYAKEGGISTIVSYCGTVLKNPYTEFRRAVPNSHLQFLSNLRPFFETDALFISHCGLDPKQPLQRTIDKVALGTHRELFTSVGLAGKLIVCGHYYQRTLTPFISPYFICVDTGCGTLPEGRLSALLLPERSIIQES